MGELKQDGNGLILDDIGHKTIKMQIYKLNGVVSFHKFANEYETLMAEVRKKNEREIDIVAELSEIKKKYKKMMAGITVEPSLQKYFPQPREFYLKLNNIQTETNRTDGKFVMPPSNPIYIIILSFLSGFCTEQCNRLLASAGHPHLHGKNRNESIFIYALEHSIPYDQCVLTYIKKYDAKIENTTLVDSFAAMETLAHQLELEGNENVQYTLLMTSEAKILKDEAALEDYLVRNAGNFRNARTTPVRYLCQWLSEYIKLDQLEPERYQSTADYQCEIKELFRAFNNFYFDYTNNYLGKFCGENFDKIWGNGDLADKDVKNNSLLKVLSGEIELKRKFFVLLYIFFHQSDWEISALNWALINCGFDGIVTDNNTMDDIFIAELNQYKNHQDRTDFMTQYVIILYYSKNYFELSDLAQRIIVNTEWQQRYQSLCVDFITIYSQMIYGTLFEQTKDIAGKSTFKNCKEPKETLMGYVFSQVTSQLDAAYRAGNNRFKFLEKVGAEQKDYAVFLASIRAMPADIKKFVVELSQMQEEEMIKKLEVVVTDIYKKFLKPIGVKPADIKEFVVELSQMQEEAMIEKLETIVAQYYKTFLESADALVSDVEKLVAELSQLQEEQQRKKLNAIIVRLNDFMTENKLNAERKNKDLSVYIENPLYLNPKIDVVS